jgi:hypothetical protein
MKKILFAGYIFLSLVISIILSILIIWAVVFSSYYTAFLFLLLFLLAVPIFKIKRLFIKVKITLCLIFFILAVFTYKIPITEVNNKIKKLSSYKREPENFAFADKAGIYGLNIIMGLSGLIIYPEAGIEALLLCFECGPENTRNFNSGFFLKSEKINSHPNKIYAVLASEKNKDNLEFDRTLIIWNGYEVYNKFFSREARIALALNPALLTVSAERIKADSWRIKTSVSVRVEYPENSYIILINDPELKVEEGLFWMLQNAGWLHPYTAVWTCFFNKNLSEHKSF